MKAAKSRKELSPERREELLRALKARFDENMNRRHGLEWVKVLAKLEAHPAKLWSLNEMERTGGEPDVVGHDKKTVHRQIKCASHIDRHECDSS